MTRPTFLVTGALSLVLLLGACGEHSAPDGASVVPSPKAVPSATSPLPPASSAASADAAGPCLPTGTPPAKLTAPDGVRLLAYVRGTGNRGVVLGHESDGGLCDLWSLGDELVAQGYRVLSLAFEGYPGSGAGPRPEPTPFVAPYADDLLAGVALLHVQGAGDVAIVGPSMGGTAAVVAGSQAAGSVRAVIDLSGPAQYRGLDAVAAAGISSVPQLLAVAASDPDVDQGELEAVDAASTARDKQLLLRPGDAHGKRLLATDPQVHAAVLAFLNRHLRP